MSVTLPDPATRLFFLPPPQVGPTPTVESPVTQEATTDRRTTS
jgi:hypothetical protein